MHISGIDFALVGYVSVILLAIVIAPGPNFALVTRTAFQGKQREARGVILGIAVAATFYATLAMSGLSLLLGRVAGLARSVQVAGGLYLIYLGVRSWRAARGALAESSLTAIDSSRRRDGFRQGVLVALSNPKAISFWVGVYAAAIPIGTSLTTRIAILAGVFVIEVGWYGFVARLLTTGKVRAFYHRFAGVVERVLGVALAGFGLKLVFSRD